MSNRKKIERKVKLEKAKAKRKKALMGLGATLAVAVMTGSLITLATVNSKINTVIKELPAWEKTGVGEYDVNLEQLDGVVTLEEYQKLRKGFSEEDVKAAEPILGTRRVNWYMKGVKSEYFEHSCIVDYEQMINEIKTIQTDADILKKLLDNIREKESIADYKGCHSDDCNMLQYIQLYTTGETQSKLLEAHQNYETLIEYYAKKAEVTDDDLKMAYQEELATNKDYIDSIEVELKYINPKLLNTGDSAIEYANKHNKLETKILKADDVKGLDYLPLYLDREYYDDSLAKSVSSFMTSVFGTSGVISNNDSIKDVTNVKDLDSWIANQKEPTKDGYDSILDDEYITYRLTGYDAYDTVKIMFNVKSVKHKELPTFDVLKQKVEDKVRVYYAESSLQTAVNEVREQLGLESEEDTTNGQ